jgi:hypothetical protein
MYILTFKRSRSKYFEKGLDLALRLGGAWDGQQMTLQIPDDQLLDAYELLLPLFSIIQNWTSTSASFHKWKVHPYRFILSMHFLKECAMNSDQDHKNCWLSSDCPGWTCKKLANIFYQELGNGKYKRNDKYWYNFGSFKNKNEWVIDKSELFSNLMQFALGNGLFICPHFKRERVMDSVYNLPAKIIPDNISYRVHFTDLFYKGENIKFPENIRHISQRYRDQEGHEKLKYDPSKIIPIRHYERVEISVVAMKELLSRPVEMN